MVRRRKDKEKKLLGNDSGLRRLVYAMVSLGLFSIISSILAYD